MHHSTRTQNRVHATQEARLVVQKIVTEMHSACVAAEVAPVQPNSGANAIAYVYQTGSGAALTPVLHEVVLSGTTLNMLTYPATSGSTPSWTFSTTASASRTLMTNVAPVCHRRAGLQLLRLRQQRNGLLDSPDHPAERDRCGENRPGQRRPQSQHPHRPEPGHQWRGDRPEPGLPALQPTIRQLGRHQLPMRMSRLRQDERGFTMLATMIGATVVMSLALVAVTATRGDIPFTSRDIASKKAYEAAKAGIEDYAAHLYADSLYWTKCAEVPAPSAVNKQGSTTKRRAVPGDASATYAIELLPATTQTTYTQCATANPGGSMLETSGPASGSFRIRSNGFAGSTKVGLIASFKRPSFLDYVYFTQLETLDPIAYGYANPSTALTGAYSQCELTYEQGRNDNPIPGTGGDDYCSVISFITGDAIEGPMHTNDTISVCGTPRFGRTVTDMIEIGGKSPGLVHRLHQQPRPSPGPKSPRRRSWCRPNRTRNWRASPNRPSATPARSGSVSAATT